MKPVFMRLAAVALALGVAAPSFAAQDAPAAMSEIAVGDALPHAFFVKPAGTGPFPAVVVLGGSEGGDRFARSQAKTLLAEGYAVLGLPYYSPAYPGMPGQLAGLPQAFASIPLEKLAAARDWLNARSDVKRGALGVLGVSKGAEFALAGTSRIPGYAAVVAIVPSDVIWEGWGAGTKPGEPSSFAWEGRPLPFVPYLGMEAEFAKFGTGERPNLRKPQDAGRAANPDRVPAARIAVEKIAAPVLVAGGDKDEVWASGPMARTIAAERGKIPGLETVTLTFPDAGHMLSGTGVQSTNPAFQFSDSDLAAQRSVWQATRDFLAKYLKRDPASK